MVGEKSNIVVFQLNTHGDVRSEGHGSQMEARNQREWEARVNFTRDSHL